jgi:hypothetical protein
MYEDIAVLPKYPLHEKGNFVICHADGTVKEGVTLQCVHCGMHWIVQPGSGRNRGWCLKCGGPTCGKPDCHICEPIVKKLEREEKARR